MRNFDISMLTAADDMFARGILGGHWRAPDLSIAPDGNVYLMRWHLIPRNEKANVYFHIQVASDPERPLHDHPWDNTSVILTGGYDEMWNPWPWDAFNDERDVRKLRAGDTIHRHATEAHRLILPANITYTMTIFSTGPRLRDWGFWFPDGWRSASEVTAMENGQSIMTKEARKDADAQGH